MTQSLPHIEKTTDWNVFEIPEWFQEQRRLTTIPLKFIEDSSFPQCATLARSFGMAIHKALQTQQEWANKQESRSTIEQTELELGVEREIVVRVPPYSKRNVKIRAKRIGRATPRVVFDPLPENE
jgi:hypothetical protein